MDRDRIIEFLTEKTRLAAHLLYDGRSLVASNRSLIKRLRDVEDFDRQVRFLDHDLDICIRGAGGKAGVASTRAALKEKFGIAALTDTPDAVARKILKRGAIASLEEAQVLRDLLADGPWCEDFGEKRCLKLEFIFSAYEKSLRPPP